MPIVWILIVGGILYWVLRMQEAKYASGRDKQTDEEIPAAATEAATEAAVEPPEAVAAPEPDAPVEVLPFIDTIAGLPGETKTELEQMALTTAEAISNTPDKKLLAVKGIGPARLRQIRSLCADAMEP